MTKARRLIFLGLVSLAFCPFWQIVGWGGLAEGFAVVAYYLLLIGFWGELRNCP